MISHSGKNIWIPRIKKQRR